MNSEADERVGRTSARSTKQDTELTPTMSQEETAGSVIGRYHLLQKIGEGRRIFVASSATNIHFSFCKSQPTRSVCNAAAREAQCDEERRKFPCESRHIFRTTLPNGLLSI